MLTKEERATLKLAEEIITRECGNDGDECQLRGFGTFRRLTVKEKTARNPQTGDAVKIPARSVLRFKASKSLTK